VDGLGAARLVTGALATLARIGSLADARRPWPRYARDGHATLRARGPASALRAS
jgi:hypothetical protein